MLMIYRLLTRMLMLGVFMLDEPGAGGAAGAGAGAGGAAGAAGGEAGAGAAAGGKKDEGAGAGTGGAGAGAGAGASGGAGEGGAAAGAGAKATWPEDWRVQVAGGDEKAVKQLERFASPKDVHTAWRSLQQRLSSGELKSTLPKDAKPEEVAKWRAENGVPDKPEGYKMPEGLEIGENDKPLIGMFLQEMHGKNASPEIVQSAVATYYKVQEQQLAAIAEADVTHKTEMEDTLRAEWGGEYRGNVNAMSAMLDNAPGGIKDKILSARTPDGRAIANDPDVLRWLAGTARELNPVATVVPAGGDQMGAITSEIAAIEKRMATDRTAYFKDEKAQARYRELVAARDRKK